MKLPPVCSHSTDDCRDERFADERGLDPGGVHVLVPLVLVNVLVVVTSEIGFLLFFSVK